jgi:type I restriction enzyme S subunit
MNQWPLKPIGDVCEVNPRLPRGHDVTDEQIVSFLPMAAVDEVSGTIQDRQCRPFSEVKKGYTHFKNRDVLFAKITPCMENGKAVIADDLTGGLGFGSTEFHVLRAKEEVLPEWLFYFVRQPAFRSEAKRNFTGTAGQQRVPTTFLSSTVIPVPPIPEQRRIVDLLSRAKGIVRLRREAEKKASELIPAIFLDMFGGPATNPKGWPVAAVGDVIDAADYGSSTKATSEGEGLPLIRMGNVSYAGNLDLDDLKFVSLPPAEVARYSLRDGDILFNRTNSKELVGKTGLWDGRREAIAASYFIRLRVKAEAVVPHYLWAFMNCTHMKRVLFDTARGAIGQANINSKELKVFRVPVPPLALQRVFASRCMDVIDLSAQQLVAGAKAQATFDALLASSFSCRTERQNG